MASITKILWCGFVIIYYVVAVVVDVDTLHKGKETLVRNRRQSCLRETLTCSDEPFEQCAPQMCLGVKVMYTPFVVCEVVCSEPTTSSPNNDTTFIVPYTSGLNDSLETNWTSSNPVNVTNYTPATSTPSEVNTTLHWRDDPSFCAANYECKNGGACDPKYINAIPKCICPKGYQGKWCEIKCSLECPANSSCIVLNGTEQCNCQIGSDIPGCREQFDVSPHTYPEPQQVWFIPVIALISLMLISVLLYFLLIKLRWRSLLVTKMFHFLQPYEDDEEKRFDAFISFRSSNKDYSQSEDEKFVYRVLQPVLEKESSYKLCIHQRDFQPGETIANNIIWAVENSRRTILVLSPLYVESDWTRLEYQKALEEMSKLRHKIIPIIFEDISNVTIEDPNLKQILSSVTYIKHPKKVNVKDDKNFWSMIRLAMPKLRNLDP